MAQPRWLAEIDSPANRGNLWMSVWSGYAISGVLAVLAVIAGELGVVPHNAGIYGLVGLKVVVNSLALGSHLLKRGVLELAFLNTMADLVCLTGAIYFTGGPLSPLFVTYVIEITLFAFFTNRSATAVVATLSFVLYSGMLVLVYGGVIPPQNPPAAVLDPLTLPRLWLMIGYAAFVLGATTLFTTGVLNALAAERAALQRRTEELIEAGEQKTLFMANVTHELRTPIHGIGGLTDLLEAEIYGPVTDDQREAHRSIKESSKNLLRMVDDLLSLAKADAGSLELRLGSVKVPELVEAVASSVSWMVGTKELALETDVAPDVRTVVTDRGRLSQILINLLSNAVKFTPEGGKITLAVRTTRDGLRFAVTDTGIGIPEEEREKIFQPFRQVDGGDEREYGGVGLGLSLVSRLARALAGSVTVESEVDHGSTFTLTLPRVHPANGRGSEKDHPQSETSGAHPRMSA